MERYFKKNSPILICLTGQDFYSQIKYPFERKVIEDDCTDIWDGELYSQWIKDPKMLGKN